EILPPGGDQDQAARAVQRYVADVDVGILLRRVRAKLQTQQQHIGSLADDLAALKDHIVHDRRFAAAGDDGVAGGEGAIADANVFHRRAVAVFVGQRTFAAFERDAVVIDGDGAVADRHVLTTIHVNAIGAGRARGSADV